MSARSFERSALFTTGKRAIPAYQISCSVCGTTEKLSSNTHGGTMAVEQLCNRFRNKGWTVGSKPTRDICPDCAGKQSRKDNKGNIVMLKPVNTQQIVTPIVSAEQPKEMSRDARRIIFAELQDRYVDEKVGYSQGWSDKRVAETLCVPRAWVAEIREVNFGPEGHDEQTKKVVADAQDLLKKAEQASRDLLTQNKELIQRIENLTKHITALEKLYR